MKKGVGSLDCMLISWRILRIQVVCCTAEVAAIYSASHVDSALMDCFMEPQHIGVPWYVWTIPEIDLLSSASEAKSESEKNFSKFDGTSCAFLELWSGSVWSPVLKRRPWCGVYRRYLMSLFKAIQCLLVGVSDATDK